MALGDVARGLPLKSRTPVTASQGINANRQQIIEASPHCAIIELLFAFFEALRHRRRHPQFQPPPLKLDPMCAVGTGHGVGPKKQILGKA
jgi:hypothetical protein